MPSPLITAKTVIGAKTESTPYTYDQPAAADYNFRAFNISVSPAIESAAREYATGDYGKHSMIMGKRTATVSFSTHMSYGGAATTEPGWGKLLEACGYTAGTTAAGVVWMSSSYACDNPVSIDVQIPECDSAPDALLLQFRGCKGNVTFVQENIGNAMRMDFEFTGVFHAITDRAAGSLITPSLSGTEAEAVLASTITAFGDTIDIESLNLNTNNEVALYTDPSQDEGVKGAYIVDRAAPSLQIDPYTSLIADSNMYSRWTGGTTGALSMTVGTNFTLVASAIQITEAYGTNDRNKMSVNQINAVCNKVGADMVDGVIMLIQGSD